MTFKAEQLESGNYETTKAFLLHQTTGFHSTSSIFTVHDIHQGDAGPIMGAGQLLNQRDEQALLDALLGNVRHHCQNDIMPSNVLVSNPRALIWYKKAHTAPIYFYTDNKKISFTVPWPTLLFKVIEGQLSIAALKVKSRPTRATALYHAPVMNTYTDGRVCTGTAKQPSTWTLDAIPKWENVIYRTNNSHVNQPHTLTVPNKKEVSSADHLKFWKQLSKSDSMIFPVDFLSPMPTRLGQWIR